MDNAKQTATASYSDSKLRYPENAKNTTSEADATEEADQNQSAYQIRPQLYERFKPLTAKEMIHNVLFDQLSTKSYTKSEAPQWCKQIADIITQKIKEMNPDRYKFIVNVVIGEQRGAGVKVGTRCIWDTESDSYAFDNFMNDTLFCVAAVYAVYFY